jgi:hypothetical protein
MEIKEIPQTWLILFVLVGLVIMRILGVDSWTTASLSLIIGYMTGKHIEQGNKCVVAPETSIAPIIANGSG